MKKATALLILRDKRPQDLENPIEQLYIDEEEEIEQLKLMSIFLSHAQVNGMLRHVDTIPGEELQKAYLMNKYIEFLEIGLSLITSQS